MFIKNKGKEDYCGFFKLIISICVFYAASFYLFFCTKRQKESRFTHFQFNLLCLGWTEVFIITNVRNLIHWPAKIPTIVLPIGISFYTFQLLSYVVDVYRNEVEPQSDYWKLLLYSSLFHQCIAGPIVRYETVQNEIDHRKVLFSDVFYGFRRFSIGLAKKAILANSCASITDTLLPGGLKGIHSQSALGIWLAMLCYMLQIYLDFSAYSDMAIGMGRMIGFHYLENFNYPYIAKSVQDFWRRWHISLSTFFRDYVYIPLGGNRCTTKKMGLQYVCRLVFNRYVAWSQLELYFLGTLLFLFLIIREVLYQGSHAREL